MEIVKVPVKKGVVKFEIGSDIDEESGKVYGNVELDIESQSKFVELVNASFDEGSMCILVDMRNVNYIDSSGLWAIFEGHKKAAQKNGKLVLLAPSKDVRRVLDITKMSSKIEIYEEESDAMSHFDV